MRKAPLIAGTLVAFALTISDSCEPSASAASDSRVEDVATVHEGTNNTREAVYRNLAGDVVCFANTQDPVCVPDEQRYHF